MIQNLLKTFQKNFNPNFKAASEIKSATTMPSWSTTWEIAQTSKRYDQLSSQGYSHNVIAYRCIQLIARGVGSIPWVLYQGNHKVDKHPLLDLLRHPNTLSDGNFREQIISHLLICGNAYILKSGIPDPLELKALRPDRITIVNQKNSLVYEYKIGSQIYTFLQNGGRPSGAFVIKPSNYGLTDRQREALSRDIRQAYQGSSNAGRILFLEGDFDWKEMGLSLKDLDFIEGKNLSAREIAQSFGVPPMLVGVPGDATFANYKEARYHLWEDTILPLMDLLVESFNQWLLHHYKEPLRIGYDADRIPALALRREASWAKIAEVDFLTVNEKRHAVGYGDLPEGEVLHA